MNFLSYYYRRLHKRLARTSSVRYPEGMEGWGGASAGSQQDPGGSLAEPWGGAGKSGLESRLTFRGMPCGDGAILLGDLWSTCHWRARRHAAGRSSRVASSGEIASPCPQSTSLLESQCRSPTLPSLARPCPALPDLGLAVEADAIDCGMGISPEGTGEKNGSASAPARRAHPKRCGTALWGQCSR